MPVMGTRAMRTDLFDFDLPLERLVFGEAVPGDLQRPWDRHSAELRLWKSSLS